MRKPIPKSIRNKVCARQRYNCDGCGNRFGSVINIHHIDGDNSNNDLNNLRALCHNCHDEIHNEEAVKKHQSKQEMKKEMKEEEYPYDFKLPDLPEPTFGDINLEKGEI